MPRQNPRGTGLVCDITVDRNLPRGASHGLDRVAAALRARAVEPRLWTDVRDGGGWLIVAGLSGGSGPAARMIGALGIEGPRGRDAFEIHRFEEGNRAGLLIAGSDGRGLTYALLEVADRIGWSTTADPFDKLPDIEGRPAVVERAISKLVNNRSEFESYFYSEAYWTKYLDMLARNRYTTFVLIFGYGSAGYFDPVYPYLFDLEAFPEVEVVGLKPAKQSKNLAALNSIIEMTHDRGLDFTLALWRHIYRGVDKPTPGLVWGLSDENLVPYTRAAINRLLEVVPGIDAIQFRCHVESSLSLPQQRTFWEAVLSVIKESGKDIRVDMRAKGLTDDLIETALASGARVRLTTKYWGEQMGLPYHPTHLTARNQFRRRHGYADLLRYPKRYEIHYRLWNLGTTRLLLWGSPEYARRFAASTHLWGGQGYEVHEPLAFKMAHHRGRTYSVLAPDHRYYDWEFERYWHFYQVFGLVGYSPDEGAEVWRREFEKRFGTEAAPYVEESVHRASEILPRIIAYNLSDLSTDHAWPEKQRWEDLPTYAASEPSDTAQFLGIDEAARFMLEGRDSPKVWPQQTSRWFAETSDKVLALLDEAESRIRSHRSKEFSSTMIDLTLLALLADYHSKRIYAGLSYSLFRHSDDLNALDDAAKREGGAIQVFERIVGLTKGVYHTNLVMGRGRRLTGSWEDELEELLDGQRDLEKQRLRTEAMPDATAARFDFGDTGCEDGFSAVRRDTRYDPALGGYGWLNRDLSPSPRWATGPVGSELDRQFLHGPEPTGYTYSAFAADLPNGEYELVFTMMDISEEPVRHGPMWIVANGMDSTRRFVVHPRRKVKKMLKTTVTDGRLNVVFNSVSGARWMINSLEVIRLGPAIHHVPLRRVLCVDDLVVRATARSHGKMVAVDLWYRGREADGFRSRPMKRVGPHRYEARLPKQDCGGEVEYFIRASDAEGRSSAFPSDGLAGPIRIRILDDTDPPEVIHDPITECRLGEPLRIAAEARDRSGVKWVRLRYRGLNQHQDYRTAEMVPTGLGDVYEATIPPQHIRPEWDLMYFIEAMDNLGNGSIFPSLETGTPYVVVEVRGRPSAHEDVSSGDP